MLDSYASQQGEESKDQQMSWQEIDPTQLAAPDPLDQKGVQVDRGGSQRR